jgi:endonuclease/exonuclease/phosphatase family metal-dependent hydrolase
MKWLKTSAWFVLVLAGLAGAYLILATLTDYRPEQVENIETYGNAGEISEADSIFSILTWNIGYFGLGRDCDFFYDGGKMSRPPKAAYLTYSAQALKYLEKSPKTDFYFFQEVDIHSSRSYFDEQVEKIRGIFPGYESAVAVNYKVQFVPMPLRKPMGKVKSGLLSLSAFTSSEHSRYAFSGGYSWPVGLFMLDRCFLLTRIPLSSGKDLVLINTHNEAFDDGSQRKQQLALLKDRMLEEYAEGNYVIAGGDWNQNPVGYLIGRFDDLAIGRFDDLAIGRFDDLAVGRFSNSDVRRIIEPVIEPDFLPEEWQWVFDPGVPTNRDVNAPYQQGITMTTIIDFFVVSPNVEVLEVRTEDLGFEWSDHQPVAMKFKLRF